MQKPFDPPIGPRRVKPKAPKATKELAPNAKSFDLSVGGHVIGFRGDVYQLVSGVLLQSVRINGLPFPIHEKGEKLLAFITNFVTYEVEIVTNDAATSLRFHVTEANDSWTPT